ncbi:hypothetical protein Tco_0488008 [Tanacetum coccineum]
MVWVVLGTKGACGVQVSGRGLRLVCIRAPKGAAGLCYSPRGIWLWVNKPRVYSDLVLITTDEGALIEQSTPLRHPSPVRQRTPSPARQLTLTCRQPSPKVVHSSETNPSPFMEDDIAGGDFYVSPNRSYEAPPTTDQPAGRAEEPDALTILSSKLDRCMDQIGALETELKDTKKTLRGAVLTLVGRVKHLEGDLKVLLDSMEGGAGYSIWGSQQNWQVRSWRLYTFSNVHVLETMAGIVLYMFVDVPYPLSVKLMERMLKHKLELAKDVVGNDLTTAEQLIGFIKNQLAAAQVPAA